MIYEIRHVELTDAQPESVLTTITMYRSKGLLILVTGSKIWDMLKKIGKKSAFFLKVRERLNKWEMLEYIKCAIYFYEFQKS